MGLFEIIAFCSEFGREQRLYLSAVSEFWRHNTHGNQVIYRAVLVPFEPG